MLIRDHKAVRQMGRDLAAELDVTPTPPADDAGARAHAEAMATLLPAIQNEELKALVVKVAPAFQAHMVAAQNLDKQLAGNSGTSDRYE